MQRLWKLRAGALVHHGYLRPGHGNIVGDCPGVGLRPYEETCDDIRAWMSCTIGRIESLTARSEQIEAMQVSHKAYRTLPTSSVRYVVGAWRLEFPSIDVAWPRSTKRTCSLPRRSFRSAHRRLPGSTRLPCERPNVTWAKRFRSSRTSSAGSKRGPEAVITVEEMSVAAATGEPASVGHG